MDDEDRSYFATEWRAAQAITLTIPDLVTAAKQELRFLTRVSQHPSLTQSGPTLDCAIRRYEVCWLPLLASQEKGSPALVPPLDCAWIWHCHRLNPVRYAQDCKAVCGRILGAPMPEPRAMVAATEATIQRWKKHYPTVPYHHHNAAMIAATSPSSRISYNLEDAALRQGAFYHQVSQLHVRQEAFLVAAEMRYKGFLHLAAKSKGKLFLVPTCDIDLMWHAHQLDVMAYRTDTLRILGKVLEHDDREKSKLSTCFLETQQLWEETYRLPFEKAGALWRGEPPTPLQLASALPISNRFTSCAFKAEQEAQYAYLTARESVQMRINVLSRRNIPERKKRVFVRMRAMRSQGGEFEMRTPEVEWNQGPWTVSFETRVEGVVLELRMRKRWKSSTLLGEAHVPFSMLTASPTLSALDWLVLHKEEQIWELHRKAPALEIAASITPPVPAPYLFRAVNAKTTDDHFREVRGSSPTGRWFTRSFLDHQGKLIYTVRIRKLKSCQKPNGFGATMMPVAENERTVNVYRPNRDAKSGDPRKCSVTLAASAIQLTDTPDHVLERQWALFEPNTIFTVRKNRDPRMDEYPELTVDGAVGSPVGLVSGRWLQYEVPGSKPEDERGFVTVVRYSSDCPRGRATALFNWQSAAMEVSPGENVVFVVLLCTVTGLAVHDLLGTMSMSLPMKVTKKTTLPEGAEWGAVNVESGVGAYGPSSTNRFWWMMSSQVWAQEMYETGSKTDVSDGAGGACRGGMCDASGCKCGRGSISCGGNSLVGASSFSGSFTGSYTSTP